VQHIEQLLYSNVILCAVFKAMDERATLGGILTMCEGFFAFIGAEWNQQCCNTTATRSTL
jgi:hypothetical protein